MDGQSASQIFQDDRGWQGMRGKHTGRSLGPTMPHRETRKEGSAPV